MKFRSIRSAVAIAASAGLLLTACAAPDSEAPVADALPWNEIEQQAQGQTVSLWMYGGDEQGNAYVDDVLTPAAAEEGVTLRR
ncbi:MAG: ABC transporter substrate-binding protein, partial [Rhodococcus sp. (in: high G+C Gram-positive bacteria)]